MRVFLSRFSRTGDGCLNTSSRGKQSMTLSLHKPKPPTKYPGVRERRHGKNSRSPFRSRVHTLISLHTKKQKRDQKEEGLVRSRDEILETLGRLNPELRSTFKVRRIGLFGSFARQEQRRTATSIFLWISLKMQISLILSSEVLFGRPAWPPR